MLFHKNFCVAATILFVCSTSFAQLNVGSLPAATQSVDFDIEARITSNRTTRGVSDSALNPSASLTINAVHDSGMVALLEVASVSNTVFIDGKLNALFGLGYRGGNPDGVRYGVGTYYEFFPGAKYIAPMNLNDIATGTSQKRKFDTGYLIFEVGYSIFDIRYEHTITKNFRGITSGNVCPFLQDPAAQMNCYDRGDIGSGGTGYLSLIAKYKLSPTWDIGGHVGIQKVRNFDELSLRDIRLSLDYKTGNLIFGIDATAAKVKDQNQVIFIRANGDTYKANKPTIAVRASYKF